MKGQIQKITHVEHILKHPDSYVGSSGLINEQYWILGDDSPVLKTAIAAIFYRRRFRRPPILYGPRRVKIS